MNKCINDIFRDINHPIVVQVLPTNDYKVYVYFNDGTIHLVDMKPQIKPSTVFEALQDPEFFRCRATVLNNTLAWDVTGDYNPETCIDVALEFLYEFPEVSDPLSLLSDTNTPSINTNEENSSTVFSENEDGTVVFIPAHKVSLARKKGINIQRLIDTVLDEQLTLK